jgi:small conductance mechanosensitive channel
MEATEIDTIPAWIAQCAAWDWLDIGARFLGLIVTWAVVWFLVRYASRVLERLDEQAERITPRDIRTLDKLLDYLFIIVGIVISLALVGLTDLLYSALTAAGVVGIMIGFAVKDVASNFVSGIFILIDQHFAVGDAIKIGEYSGTVTDVSLRTTTIAAFDGTVVNIPNSNVATTPVTNYSIEKVRRISAVISILGEGNINLALQTIQQIIKDDERLSKEKDPIIYVSGVQDGAVSIQVFCYVDVSNLLTGQSDLLQRIVERFREENIPLAIPVRINVNQE